MNILMLSEFFHPFTLGGTEWSVYHLTKSLLQKGTKVIVLTPNYGTVNYERWKSIEIRRFAFPVHLSTANLRHVPPILHNNIIFWLISFFAIYSVSKRKHIDIIHVHSKSLIPGAILAKYLLNIPVVVTVRDYFVLCPYGLCINKDRAYKACTIGYLFKNELPLYIRNYVGNLSLLKYIFHYFSAINAKLTTIILRFLLKHADVVVAISQKQKEIFEINGFSINEVIYNTVKIPHQIAKRKNSKKIVFIGRLTPGKGADLFIDAFLSLLRQKTDLYALVIGDGFLKSKLVDLTQSVGLNKIKFLGNISYSKVFSITKNALAVVVPSRWEEPFGRVALESLIWGIPTVVSNRGGLPEIITNGKTGLVCEPNPKAIFQTLVEVVSKNSIFRRTIFQMRAQTAFKFSKQPVEKYLNMYCRVINK